MKNRCFHSILLIAFVHGSVISQSNPPENNSSYQIGQFPGMESFSSLNETELRMDSITKAINSKMLKMAKADGVSDEEIGRYQVEFKENRARLHMNTVSNNTINVNSKFANVFLPCRCALANDTITVLAVGGLFAGAGIEVLITADSFIPSYVEYADGMEIFSLDTTMATRMSNLKSGSIKDKLILSSSPTFIHGELLTGYLEFESKDWFEYYSGRDFRTESIEGKMYFTCVSQENKKP